jgi:NitT/TauT family transport system substrate-binding protein
MNRLSVRLCMAAGIISLLVLAGCGGSSAGGTSAKIPLKIMVGGLSKQIYLPNELTQQLGYFAREGLDVTLIDEASGQSSEDQVLAGQVDAGSGSYNHTIELQTKGENMECVVQLGIAPGEAEMVSTQQAGKIHSIADLKGKNLGVTELGSGTQTLTTALLHQAGITPDQVHFVPVGAGTTFIAAMEQGKIDAGMTTEPTISQLLSSNVGSVLADLRTPALTRQALGGNYPFICVFMTNDYVNAHRSVVQKMVNAYVLSLKYIQSHTATEIADKMPADYYAGNKTQYVQALQNQLQMFSPDGKMPSDGPQTVLGIERQIGKVTSSDQIDLSKTYTNTFASSAG